MESKISKIKVLMPVLHYPPVIGGFEVFIQNIAERLGHEMPIFVVTGRVKDVKNYEEKGNLKIFRTSFWSLNNLSYTSKTYRLMALFFIFFKSWRLIKTEGAIGQWRLHCHGFFSGLIGLALKKLTGVPYLITIQSADLNIYHPRLEKIFWRLIHFWDFLKFLEKKIYLNAFKCHSVSEYLSDYYGDYGIKDKDNVMISNSVDQELFRPIIGDEKVKLRQGLGFNKEDKIIVSVSRLEKKNGTEDLIKALKYLQFSDYQLLIIGNGTERKYLEQLAKDLSLENEVKFLGDMVNTEVPKYLQIADLFVRVPLAEGFGIVYIEAMACGVPVIATPVGGIIDFIKDGENGLFCQVNNPQDLAGKINLIFKDTSLKQKLINNGLNLVREKYNWDKNAEEIKKICLQPRLIIATGIFPPDKGGPATYTERLTIELNQRGIDTSVITYTDGQNKKYSIFDLYTVNRKYHLFLRYFLYFRKLKKLAKNANLIYAQCPLGSGLPTWLVNKFTKKPYIIKITGDYAWEQAGERFGVKDSMDDFQNKKYGLRVELTRKLEKMVTKMAKQVIVPSQYLKKIVQGWGVDENKIVVIYNGSEFDKFYRDKPSSSIKDERKKQDREEFREKLGFKDGEFVIISIGRPVPWKGFLKTSLAISELIKDNKLPIKLKILGIKGKEELMEVFELEDNKKEKYDRILEEDNITTSLCSYGEVSDNLMAADLFILNTAYEGMSHSILEAMACGVPIITTNVGGNSEVIENNVNGLLVEYNNSEQIKEAILRIYNHPELAEKFVQNGYEKLKLFSFDAMIKQTVNLIYGILS